MKNLVIIFSFFISGITIAQIPNYVPTSGLVGWWPFDGNANDLSGNANNGIVNGATLSPDRFNVPNKSYYFNSSNCATRIDINNFNYNGIVSSFSISFWVKRVGNGCISPRLFEFGNGAGWGVNWINGNANMDWVSGLNIPNNTWFHLVYVIQPGTIKSYVNGTFNSQFAITNSIASWFGQQVCFGRMNHPAYDAFNGNLDDVGTWNRPLTDCEIQQLYLSQTTSLTISAGPDQTVCSGSPITLTATGASSYSWSGGVQNGVPFTPTTSGTYIVTGTNSNGCIGTDTVNISVIPTPIISVTQDTICTGQTTTLTASSTSSASGCLSLTGSLNTGLVGYWPFCGNANDETVNNNNGIVYGATLTTDRFGVANNAYSFNGVNSYIDVPHSTSLNIANSYSVEFWVYNLNNSGGWYSTVSKDNWFSNQGFINYIAATVIASVNCAASNHATTTLPINAWIHIAVTYENNTLKVYKNGSLVATENQSFANATTSLRFGARHQNDGTGITNFFFGKLDDIGLWNRALTPSEIQQLYSLGQATYSWTPGGATTPSITVSPASTTTYSCDVTNSNGVTCTASQQVVVAPFQVNAGPDLTVLPGTQVSLTASGATTYTWTGGISNGISFTANTTQTYIVTGTNSAGCVATDTVTVNVVSPPSIYISTSSPVVCLGDSITLTSQLVQSSPLSLSFPYSKLNGNEIWVSPSGNNQTGTGTYNNPFQTIQYAIGQAANGQIVTLKNGTYSGTGNVNVSLQGKQITVQSENGPLYTILDCNQSGRGFIANSGETMNTLIKGIQIKNGKTNTAPLGYASAIFVEDNSGLKIIECIFQSNIEGCIRFGDTEVSGPQSAIENCAFIQNQQSCITADKKSFYTESCFFYGNTSTGELFGNGHVANPAQYYQNCVFKCNSGNIIGALGHGKLMSNSLFIGNTSTQGTIYMGTNWSGTNTVDHCTFYNNTCNYYNSGWYDHTGQVLSSIFYPGNARNHVSGNQGQIPFSNSLGNNISGNGNIQGNPLFVNPGANNFNLQSGSPCIGTGASGTNMGANPSLIQPWLFSFLNYYSQTYSTVTWENGAQTPSITISPTTSGYISVTYAGCGTQITDSLYVQVINQTSVNAGLNQTICSGSSITLTATGASTYSWTGGVQNGVPFVPSTSGNYIVTGTNSNGCTAIDTVVVTVLPTPVITTQDSVICSGDSTTLTASAIGAGISSSCTGTSPVNYTTWTPIAPADSYTNIIKEGSVYYLRSQTNVFQANSIIGPWNSMNFNTQIGNTIAQRMLGLDWSNRLVVSTGHNSLYAYNNGTWQDIGLGGFGCGGNFIHKLANGRIIVEKNGYLRDLYISDNNAVSYTNVTNVDNDYFDMIVAPNGHIYACGGSNTPSMTGLIKSTNNGSSFTQINSQLGISFCSGFAKDCSGSIYAVADNKIFKSIDGNNWVQHCFIPAFFTATPWYSFLVISSSGDYYLWSATNTLFGFFKSSDQGVTWVQITDLPTTVNNVTNLKEIDGNIVVVTNQGIFAKTLIQSPTYSWSTGATTQSITVNPTQTTTYTVTVDYGNGTLCSSSFTVNVNPVSVINAGPNQNICSGSSVTLTATGASSYSWSSGIQNGVPFTPTVSGSYIVTETNSNGCTSSDTVIVTVNNNPTISSVVNNVLCFGGSTGSINTTIANGMSPYTFSWNSGQTTSNIQSLVAGNYTINVTDNNGCTATATYNVQSPSALQLSGLVSSSNCSNVATGAIDLTVIGGLAPYSTLWSTGAVTQDLQNIGGGMYTVQVTDMNGCVVNDTFQVSQSTAIQVTSSVINPTCSNLNNGQIDISITGGTPAFAYSWSNGQTNQDLTNIGVGNYSLTVTDALGCLSTVNFNLSAPAPLNITFNSNTIGCYGAATGQINSTVSGGVQPYSYFWSNGATTPNLNNVVAGNYTLTVNDAGGCAFSASSSVQQPSNPLIITAIVTPINCTGASTGAIDVTVSGGTMFYSYAWNNGSINQDLQNIGSGSYSLNIVDGNGCIYDTIFYVSQPTNALASQISQVNVSCQNGGNGSIDLTVTGGQIPYNYIWSNGATTQDLIALSAGTYSVIITDGNGCMKYDTISITQPLTSFSLSGNITNVACFGASTGTIDLIVSGGTGPYTYIWSNGGSSQDLNNLSAGSYNVLVYDIFNCQTTQTFTLTQPVFALQASALVTNLICASNPTGSIDVSVTGGTSPYTYLWSNGQTTLDLLNVGAGTYSLTISDNNGCQVSLSETINAPSQPLNTTALPANASCFGYSDGQISLTTTGGVTPYTYLWSNGQNTNLVDSLPAGIYNVIVTDFNGCENNLSIQINQPNEILNSFQPSSTFGCFPSEIQFTYPVNDPSLTFTWNFGNGTTSGLQNPSVLYEAAGCFDVSLTVTADNGCSVTNQLDSLICMAQGPEASFYSTTSSIDFYTGELSLFDDSEGSIISYLWTLGDSSPNQTSQNIIHYYTPYIQQDYNVTLTVTDSNGCTDVASMIFSLTEEFEIYVPNTITINGDNLNEGLLPIFSNVDIMQDYEMSIYNRWGNLVWQTTNPSEPWYGRYKDSKDVQTGVYTWKIKYTDNKQVTRTLVGHVNVLR